MGESSSFHAGHRQRMKDRFLSFGLDSMSPHEILELLLYYAIPQKDVNELSHRLMERFGSVSGVLEADYEDLCSVDGIGPNAAALFRLVCETARYYTIEIGEHPAVYDSLDKIGNYLVNFFLGMTVEKAYIMLFDNRMKLIDMLHLSDGTVNNVNFSTRLIIEKAIKKDAAGVILTHNHPRGTAVPSAEDYSITYALQQTLALAGITLIDHIVVSGKYYTPILAPSKTAVLSSDSPASDSDRFYDGRDFSVQTAASHAGDTIPPAAEHK